jgi:hypothetical protein
MTLLKFSEIQPLFSTADPQLETASMGGCGSSGKGSQVKCFHIRNAILPTAKQNPNPFISTGSHGSVMPFPGERSS